MQAEGVSYGTLTTSHVSQGDIQGSPADDSTEKAHLVGVVLTLPESEAPPSLLGRLKQNFQNLSTTKKLYIAAVVTLTVGGAATIIALWPYSKDSDHPPAPGPCWKVPHNATEICNAISTIGSASLQWLAQAPGIATLVNVQNGLRQLFCSGAKIVDPATIAWAQNILPQLTNAIANQTAIALTGFPYDPMNQGAHQSNPTRLYNLIYHANADFKQTDNWFGMEDFWAPGWIQWAPQYISMNLMSQGATMALKEFCDRMNFSDILFANGTYTCVAKQFADYIPQFAGWCFWRNQTISS